MDPATLATTALSILVPLLQKAGSTAAEAAGESATKRLLRWLKSKLKGPGEPEAIEGFERSPGDPTQQKLVAAMLEAKLKTEDSLADELESLLREIKPGAFNTQGAITIGNDNVATQISGSGNTVTTGKRD